MTAPAAPILLDAALAYHGAGLCALPALRRGDEKRVALRSWKQFQKKRPDEDDLRSWFGANPDAICIVCGAVSGNLEMIDFDLAGELFPAWRSAVEHAARGLVDRMVIESTPSGGRHVVYRCEEPVSGNTKLAQRRIAADGPGEVVIGTKAHRPRKDASGEWAVIVTTIETRGEGGIFLCAPSAGYELMQGDLRAPPTITADERDVLLGCAWALNEVPASVHNETPSLSSSGCASRPGDDFNQRGDVREVLRRHGWTLLRPGDNEHWCRPGKHGGTSATLKDGVFYVFSTNAPPFEPHKGYPPFSVYALLEHSGDFTAAASALAAQGYGNNEPAGDVDLSNFCAAAPRAPASVADLPPDPGLLPEDLLRIPGFVSEVMDHCLEGAPYPNHVLAFCGALALQAFLAARKVRDPGDNRTNVYLLGLAHSSAGKDWPRKVNGRILHEVDLGRCIGDKVASGEAIQDALFADNAALFQTDEIDGMLQSMKASKESHHEGIMSMLLTLYSSANTIYPMRRKANEPPRVINQPCVVLFGTAIPNHYYAALSERMLTNGFFARMLIFESGPRSTGQEPSIIEPPKRIIEIARWWAERPPGSGDLAPSNPTPAIIEHTDAAKRLLVDTRQETEAEYAKAEAAQDAVGTTVWGRVSEHVRKLSLLHAISANHLTPSIDADAVRWATRIVMHQTRRMLFMAASHVASNDFHADCLRLIGKLREAPGGKLAHSVLLKRMKMKARDFRDLIETMVQRGDITSVRTSSGGRPVDEYQLIGGAAE
ncbi:MAG TPA: bifunctional DNA primase/polymerase [Phycisphaerales bacterium]|nr:bifunctional DNA primase/polymerase [Phycisphaerales bacterium]